MDATLDLVGPRPAAGALVLIALDRPGAGDAPDRRVAQLVERVGGDFVDEDVGLDALRVPVHERVDLPDAVVLRPLYLSCVRTRERLLAADAAHPGVERLERALERLDLADVAA